MDQSLDGDGATLSRVVDGFHISAKDSLTSAIRRNASTILLWVAPLAFLGLFYFYPLGSILRLSFAFGEDGLIASIQEALVSASIRRVLWFTFWQATLSTALTLLVLPCLYRMFHARDAQAQNLTPIPTTETEP